MSNVDYVIVGPGPSQADVLTAVQQAIGAAEIVNGNVLVTGDDQTSVTVYSSGPRTVVDVYYGGELAERRAVSRRIYDSLAARTNWDLALDSDDVEDVIAMRRVTTA